MRVEPESIPINVDGYSRRAYRCVAPAFDYTGRLEEANWDPKILGRETNIPMPVYVQKHAIRQTLERLHVSDEHCGLIHYFIWRSLSNPRLLSTGEGRFLVEMRVNDDKKIGYLVAEVVTDKILVKTFILPTMSGTPEARKLYDLLRLRRADIEFLGLSELGELACTDILEDETIANVFEQCGCGDLLSLIKRDCQVEKREGSAAQFREYLGARIKPPTP